MEINLVSLLLSALPLLLLIVLLIWRKWPACRAAPVILALSLVLALCYFRCGLPLLAQESCKGLWNALAILLVVFTAVLLYELCNTAGAFEAMQWGLQRLTKHELMLLLLLGYVFPSFLQGITGFGVAVAVGAPLLVGMGVRPSWAVICVLLAHSWGGTFGTLGLAWLALMENAPQETRTAAALTAGLLIWLVNLVGALCLCWFYGKGKALREGAPVVLCISLLHGGGQLLLARYSDTLACFLAASAAFVAAVLLCRTKRYRRQWRLQDSPIMRRQEHTARPQPQMSFGQALSPYVFLAVTALCCLLIEPLNVFLSRISISFSFPGGETGLGYRTAAVEHFSPFMPLTHPSFFLLLSCIFSYVVFRKTLPRSAVLGVLHRTLKKTLPSAISVICFLLTSKIMGCSGQVELLAQSFVRLFGKAYPLVAPFIGLLGSFVTSSNMASNILFGRFQTTTAGLLGVNQGVLLGAQTAGGAIGNAICPGNVVLGCTTTERPGTEGEVLKRVLPVTAVTALLCGAAAFLLVNTYCL